MTKTYRLIIEVTDERGVFQKDAVLVYDERTKGVVTAHASNKMEEHIERIYKILTTVRKKI